MKRSHALMVALAIAGLASCGGGSLPAGPPSEVENEDCLGSRSSPLFARSPVLWPVQDDEAVVRVCWAEPRVGSAYAIDEFAPDLDEAMPRAREWAREIVEQQWNGRTPLEFVGWHDCADGPADVQIVLTDSSNLPTCADTRGVSCVEALGTDLRGGTVFLNLLFGEETLYMSRYQQANPGETYDAEDDIQWRMLPQACMDEFWYGWSLGNTLTEYVVDIEDPTVRDEYMALYETCAKNLVLHEFGHIAGFAHEQLREDDPRVGECRDVIAERGLGMDWLDPGERYLGDAPLGVFDAESIMSYCRLDKSATLTDTDVEAARLAYLGPDEEPTEGDPNECEDGPDGMDGEDGPDGMDGEDGPDGMDGEDGPDGMDGEDGPDGMDGEDGPDGMDGEDGPDGRVLREIDCSESSCVCAEGDACLLLCDGGCDARCMPDSDCLVWGFDGDIHVTCAGARSCEATCEGCDVTCDACTEF
jgi:hypothetical protein